MNPLNWFEVLMLLGVVQGGLLIIAINQMSRRRSSSTRIFTLFLLSIIFNSIWENWKPADDIILLDGLRNILFFLYGALYFFCVQSLLTTQTTTKKEWLIHSSPAMIYAILLLIMYRNPHLWYVSKSLTALFVLIHGLIYLGKSNQLVRNYRRKTYNAYPYLKYLQTITLLAGFFLLTTLIILSVFLFDTQLVELFNHYITGLIGSFVIYSLAYFAVLFPEVIKLPIEEITPPVVHIPSSPLPPAPRQSFNAKELQTWKAKLKEVMITKRLYLTPTLTLDDLAQALQADKLTVSRAIREGFQQNFYDFVNYYRIEYFIQLSQDQKYQHYTISALAYEAGFNAKSTFHKVFKKFKKTTPMAYLKLINEV